MYCQWADARGLLEIAANCRAKVTFGARTASLAMEAGRGDAIRLQAIALTQDIPVSHGCVNPVVKRIFP